MKKPPCQQEKYCLEYSLLPQKIFVKKVVHAG